MRKFGVLLVAGLSLVFASGAGAQSLPISFNNMVLGTSVGNLVVASQKTAAITANATANADGTFTIQPNAISIPTASFTTPVPGQVTVGLNSPATVMVNPATGQLSLSADFTASVNVTGLGQCTVDTGTQTYSTDGKGAYPGQRFPLGAQGFLTGAGAIGGGWTSLASPPVGPGCTFLASVLNGAGSLWISRNISPPSPALALTSKPSKGNVKPGKTVTFTATVKDTGGAAASKVTVCVVAPKALKLHGKTCTTIASIAAGATASARFTFTASKTARGKLKVSFSAKSTGLTTATARSALKIAAAKAKK